jgi:hypothetical protein
MVESLEPAETMLTVNGMADCPEGGSKGCERIPASLTAKLDALQKPHSAGMATGGKPAGQD